MEINSIGDGTKASLAAPSIVTTGNSSGDFLSALNSAKKNYSGDVDVPEKQSKPVSKTAYEELQEYLSKTEAQRLREKILKQLGMTEEDLKALPPDKRAAIEDTIAQKIKEYMLTHHAEPQKTGQSSLSSLRIFG